MQLLRHSPTAWDVGLAKVWTICFQDRLPIAYSQHAVTSSYSIDLLTIADLPIMGKNKSCEVLVLASTQEWSSV